MAYRLLYSKWAFKDIKKLDKVTGVRIKNKIEEYSQNPLSHAVKLSGSIGSCRWRVGNYRIIFDIQGKNILILRIGHRREIYK